MNNPAALSFLHSGNVGDLIYGLPAVRALGGGTLYLGVGDHPQWGHRASFPPAYAESLIPLLCAQDYVSAVAVHADQPVDHELDRFRDFESSSPNLAVAHLRAFDLPEDACDTPWLTVAEPLKVPDRPVVFSRTTRYRNPAFDWARVVAQHGSRAVFVGLPQEHRLFEEEHGSIPYRPTRDFLELARLIAGCELFVSNQSAPYAIAEGLKAETILEVCPEHNNCLFDREGQRAYVSLEAETTRVRRRFPARASNAVPRVQKSVRHVLCSTTRQWNPGDELILLGVKSLLEAAQPETRFNVCVYDRNPDLQGRPVVQSNSWRGQSLRKFDAVIVAGTPEWYGQPLEPLFEAIVRDDVEPIFLGLGSPTSHLSFSHLDERVFSRSKLLTARDGQARRALGRLGHQPHLLPCPALFAARREHLRKRKQRVGLVLQRDHVVNQSIPSPELARVLELYERLRPAWDVEVICHYVDEYLWALERFERVCYSYDAKDYLEIFASCDVVVSTRLHGAVAALSTGAPSVLINRSPRCRGAAAEIPELLVASPEEAVRLIEDLDVTRASEAALSGKQRAREQYLNLLASVPLTPRASMSGVA